MSLQKKDVYSKLSDYGRKVLGKSLSDRAVLNDKSLSDRAVLNDKSLSKRAEILPTPTPPNSPIYKHIKDTKINIIPIIKTIEEPYSVLDVTKPNDTITVKAERTSFNLCKIM